MTSQQEICTHDDPVWRGRANFILMADLSSSGMPGRWEQLWAQKTGDNGLILCCIPFFAYGIALGDEISANPGSEFEWVMDRVIEDAGDVAVRAALVSDDWSKVADSLIRYVEQVGLPWEIHNQRYVAVSCRKPSGQLEELVGRLEALETDRKIEYEFSK
ncbi:MAG: DUF4265 domain-containing protein [Mycobacterium sp.]|nr:DUF4265 domain-containing protein [Mycobacterium sp.]